MKIKSNTKKLRDGNPGKEKSYGSFGIVDKETGCKIAINNKGSR